MSTEALLESIILDSTKDKTPWGESLCVDCYHCDPALIRDANAISQYVAELIELIEMKAFGPCRVVHFGEDARVAGFSMFQLIETSCISGHFSNESNHAYLDIFSCKPFDHAKAAEFTQRYFKAQSVITQAHQRW